MIDDPRTLAALLAKLAIVGLVFMLAGWVSNVIVGAHPLATP